MKVTTKCSLCGKTDTRFSVRDFVACHSCKEKRKREAATNYYNLKRRKQTV